ncbi:MAG: MarR family transcriptional regulator [Coriobacteriia bacterium]|nr:MarR family transcriptional regulator [Coriobacteriia bacterium]
MENTEFENPQEIEETAPAETEIVAEEEEAEDKSRETFRKFMEVQQLMGAMHQRLTQKGGPLGDTTRGRGRILALLKLKDGVATKDMAQILGIRVSSLNETLAKLAEDGLIERTPSEDDKRIMLVTLTDAGREAKVPSESLPECLFEGFEDEELDTFGGFLDRITANLENELGTDVQKLIEEQRAARKAFFEKPGREHGHGRDDRGHGGRDRDRGPRDGGRGGHGRRDDRDGHGHGGRDRGPRRGGDRGGRGGYGGGRGGRDGGRGGDRGGRW